MEFNKVVVVSEFKLQPHKESILAALECVPTSQAYTVMAAIYDELIAKTELFSGRAAYVLTDAAGTGLDYQCLIYCGLTLGEAVSNQETAYFQAGHYSHALVLDAIATQVLFDYTDQLYQLVSCAAAQLGLGLSTRLTPGDGELSFAFQPMIIAALAAAELDVSVTETNMLAPVKSLAYVYGAANTLVSGRRDHDCAACANTACRWRRSPIERPSLRLTVVGSDNIVVAAPTDSLLSALIAVGQGPAAPCGGRGQCGQCKVKVLSGTVLSSRPVEDGWYWACCTYPQTDCVLAVSVDEAMVTTVEFLTEGLTVDNGAVVSTVTIDSHEWQTSPSLSGLIEMKEPLIAACSITALSELSALIAAPAAAAAKQQLHLAVFEQRLLRVARAAVQPPLGLAIDVGTTTLALAVVDLTSGRILTVRSALNSQRQFGADVVARIAYCMDNGSDALKACICQDLAAMINSLGDEVLNAIVEVAVVGNTTMLQLLLGLPTAALGSYPFQPVVTGVVAGSAAELLPGSSLVNCPVSLLPGISAFVGADIAAGLLRAGFGEPGQLRLLIDLGTNGELALGTAERIVCTATAAGPAFEGAGISAGIGAVAGAINSARMTAGQLEYTTIGQQPPQGICGSGALDLLALCVEEQLIDCTGKFGAQAVDGLTVAATLQGQKLKFTQQDVRQLQLAKAAIRAGLDTLLAVYGCEYQAIGAVYLAGSFGRRLNLHSAVASGLLPAALAPKTVAAGNMALGGAIEWLVNTKSRARLLALLPICSHVDLALQDNFNEQFMAQMYF